MFHSEILDMRLSSVLSKPGRRGRGISAGNFPWGYFPGGISRAGNGGEVQFIPLLHTMRSRARGPEQIARGKPAKTSARRRLPVRQAAPNSARGAQSG